MQVQIENAVSQEEAFKILKSWMLRLFVSEQVLLH